MTLLLFVACFNYCFVVVASRSSSDGERLLISIFNTKDRELLHYVFTAVDAFSLYTPGDIYYYTAELDKLQKSTHKQTK